MVTCCCRAAPTCEEEGRTGTARWPHLRPPTDAPHAAAAAASAGALPACLPACLSTHRDNACMCLSPAVSVTSELLQ